MRVSQERVEGGEVESEISRSVIGGMGLGRVLDSPFVRMAQPRYISNIINPTKDTENPPSGVAPEASGCRCV